LSADVDYETEYNNRARVPENPAIIAGWSRDAKAYREAHQACHKEISYGAGERNRIDLFSGDGTGPIVVFIHGGYWQALDGAFFSHLAGGLNAHGIDVAVPSFTRTREAGKTARRERSFCGRASRCVHAGNGLARVRRVVAGRARDRGLRHFGAV
jgi:arylformamidase